MEGVPRSAREIAITLIDRTRRRTVSVDVYNLPSNTNQSVVAEMSASESNSIAARHFCLAEINTSDASTHVALLYAI